MSSPAHEPGIIRVDGWDRFPWLRAGFSTRQGGSSTVYGAGDLNMGWTDSDSPENVAANRSRFLRAVAGADAFELVTLSQLHSAVTHVIRPETGPLTTPEGKAVLRGDGLMTAQAGMLLGIQTADCVPVLVADTRRRAVAAFHAGWRGTLARIVEQGVDDLKRVFDSEPRDLVAAIGPCIGRCCFAVGDEVRSQFTRKFAYAPSLFIEVREPHMTSSPKIHMDLVGANRRQLLDAGLVAGHVTTVGECTSCMRLVDGQRKYFSHRGESGFTGRLMSVIGVAPT